MSFQINWEAIEKQSFSSYTRELLNEALNSGKRPNILSSDIKIMDLNFGHISPDFEILEIGDLGPDRFRGIFKFKYDGDASVTVNTKVSASPLRIYNDNIYDDLVDKNKGYKRDCQQLAEFVKPQFNGSDSDFDIPLNLTLGKFKLSSIIIIVFNKTKGLTLVFKNDPLESIEVSSTFDRIKPIAKFLQKTIETQISELFKEFLPSYLYKFSLKYTTQSLLQFHQDLLNEEQDIEEKRVLLKDLDPEFPLRISPGSLMRLTRLASSRQTLALGGALSCDRMNDDVVTKSFANAILASSDNLSWNRIHLRNSDVQIGSMGNKLEIIKDLQARSFFKNAHDGVKPKRRVVKLKKQRVSGDTSSFAETSVESPPLSASSPPSTGSTLVEEETETPPERPLFPQPNYLSSLQFKLAKKTEPGPPTAFKVPEKPTHHIDKLEHLKIQSRRLKLDKLLAAHQPSSPFYDSPPPYYL
ncbi:hypothetical protein OGAPHI_006688 [Ogataea philodendri]|uniref:Mitochondrial distribution and morphology protein 34 n=1 Tax=Ogataea philodendri TaxID=1378263 RepID=A0A9P8T146_9ASCO|nr:uncharacterized protein OGAPHI_006688 [Ogataea philodendri]KAH3661281.1 hypothetical protein OGAPHI_006688 [Ogataea philodendri]